MDLVPPGAHPVNVVFLAPGWLWLLLGIPLLALARSAEPVRGHLALRSLLCALIVLGLARPALWTARAAEHAVFVADFSASVDAAARAALPAALTEAARALPRGTRSTLILVGAPDAPIAGFDRVETVRGASPLAAALTAATLAIPTASRGSVTLCSDGAATAPAWGDALATLTERGLPLHAMALPAALRPLRVAALAAAGELRCGQSSEFFITLTGADGDTWVEFGDPQGALERAPVEVRDGAGRARFSWEPRTAGFVTLEARVDGQALRRTFAVQDPWRVLYLGSRTQGGGEALAELAGPGFTVEPGASAETPQPQPFADYDLVVLDDLPADELSDARQRELATAVTERGIGLFFSGGRGAYGPGGWHEAPAADLLPVESLQKEEKRDPSTTLVIIIDTSGSMGGERIQLAKEVARLAMMRLLPHDKVGIVEFYGAKRWAAPIQPASNSIDLQRAINRMDAGGGTVILPAIEEAYYGMQNVQTRYKHVLVLTDGGVETGAFEPLLRRMAEDGMNVSTVLIGPEAHSEFLLNLANWGRGRFYNVPDRFNLPEILLKQPTSSRLPGYKPGTFPLRAHGGAGWWGEADPHAAPPVAGYAEPRARPGAEVLMEIAGEGAPLLASWHHGLGRVTALTTEAAGAGTAPWRDWPDYGAALARWWARTATSERPPFRFSLVRRGAELELRAVRRRAGAELPAARVLADERALDFDRRAENLFIARWHAPPDVEVRVLAGSADDPERAPHRLVAPPHDGEFEESAVPPRAGLDLARAAAATGGDLARFAAAAPPAPRAGGASATLGARTLAPWCFAAALLAYLGDLFLRRRSRRSVA
jgi:Ca-activated chloride channel family protein